MARKRPKDPDPSTETAVDAKPKRQMAKPGPQVVFSSTFSDVTPNLRISSRLFNGLVGILQHCDLSSEERGEFFYSVNLVSRKLAFCYLHYHNYIEEEDRLIKSAEANPFVDGQKQYDREYSVTLHFHFDGFLVQLKSCLDYTATFPAVVLGRNSWSIGGFNDKGNKIKKFLKRSFSKEYEELGSQISSLIDRFSPWLSDIIDERDRLNHLKGDTIPIEAFLVQCVKSADGKKKTSAPMWNGNMSIRTVMDISWKNLFLFCETFMVYFMTLRLYGPMGLKQRPTGTLDIDAEFPWEVSFLTHD